MGLLEPVWRLPMVPPEPRNLDEDRSRARQPSACSGECPLQAEIEQSVRRQAGSITPTGISRSSQAFKHALNYGEVRAAEPDPHRSHRLARERLGEEGNSARLPHRRRSSTCRSITAQQPLFDKATYPVKQFDGESGVRIVPGGSSIRDGCLRRHGRHLHAAHVHQRRRLGRTTARWWIRTRWSAVARRSARNCHISAASQIGGVLEPVGALPVIIEDDVLVGGNCGVYEGTVVKRRAVLGTGTILNRSTPVYDLVRGEVSSRDGR